MTGTIRAAALSALMLAGCGGGSGSSDIGDGDNATGLLSVAVTDAPADDVAEVWVQFTGIRVKPNSGTAIEIDFDAPVNVDLLSLTGGTSRTLLDGETVPAGDYQWIALAVNADLDDTLDSYVVDQAGGTEELRIPSGSQQGLRLVSGFTVVAGATTRFMIDWDLRKALTDPVGQPGYLLRPALRITDLAEHGTIRGTVADGLLMEASCDNDLAEDTGNVVYLYEGSDQTPVDIDGSDPEPLTTARVAQDDQAAGAYTFAIRFVPPGEYTAAFSCQGLADDPEATDDLVFVGTQNVTVAADADVTADF